MNAFTVADDSSLIELIQQARSRLVFMAPAVSIPVAEALIERLNELKPEAVAITLDVDAETYRLGYGDPCTLDLLYAATRQRGCPFNRQVGLRIGVVISDDRMMVYAPTPLLIELGPHQEHRPNAVMVGPPSPTVLCEVGFGEHGYKEQTIGRDLVKETEITPVQEDLRINPPQKFDLARTVRVFNAHIDFVEFELVGTAISQKTVSIPTKFMGLDGDEKAKDLLRASYRVVGQTDMLSGKDLAHDKSLIIKKFLKSLPGYGTAILRTQKDEFEVAIEALRKSVESFKKKIAEDLQKEMDTNRKALHLALLPSVLQRPPKDWESSDGSKPKEADVGKWFDEELRSAFGSAEKLIGKMEVKVLYKAVTYESLKDPKFIEVAKRAFPSLDGLLDESHVAAAVPE
ncbi:MAG: hypothetical protein AABZ34_18590 [Nitrospirota bacterium]